LVTLRFKAPIPRVWRHYGIGTLPGVFSCFPE